MSPFWWSVATAAAAAAAAAGAAACTILDSDLCLVKGPSMLPTIRADGEVALLDRRCLARDFSRGDVVVFRKPTDRRISVVQRLIALPGDSVQIPEEGEIRQVPDGHCWVEGDNAGQSCDSRHYGPVPLGLMEGRITHIIWPPDRIHRVHRMVPEGRIMTKD